MAAHQEVQGELLVDERDSEMMSLTGSKQPMKRTAWFLLPTSDEPTTTSRRSGRKGPAPDVVFKGWFYPTRNWRQWVDKLRPVYGDLWRRTGILDAINASTFVVRRDPSSLSAVARLWNGETNTFHFLWAEATITLEDVMILGGFSVLGEPVQSMEPLTGELHELELKMNEELTTIVRSPGKKATHSAWTNRFIEGEANEIEHAAFLSLWLSRFVFPDTSVRRSVIPIAVRLARGVRIALAPAVLASLYRDLRAMRNHYGGEGVTRLPVLALLRILQLWLWERFLLVRPEETKYVKDGEPRVARWHKVGKKTEPSQVQKLFRSAAEFQWRPYAIGADKWRIPGFYKDDGGWFSAGGADEDEAIGSLSRCLRASELVGLDCIEQYLPHRVAMQFGLDQEVPGSVPRANSSCEVAWKTYDLSEKKVTFYVPPRLFKPDVTCVYANWWKQKRPSSNVGEHTLADWLALRKCNSKLEKKQKPADVARPPNEEELTDPLEMTDSESENDAVMTEAELKAMRSKLEAEYPEYQREIKRQKEEIAVLAARVAELESQAQVHSELQPLSCLLYVYIADQSNTFGG